MKSNLQILFVVSTALISCQSQNVVPIAVKYTDVIKSVSPDHLKESQVVLKSNGRTVTLTDSQKAVLVEESIRYLSICNFNSANSTFVPSDDIPFREAWAKDNSEKILPKSHLAVYFRNSIDIESISGHITFTEILFDLTEKDFTTLPLFTRSLNHVVKYNKCGPVDPLCQAGIEKYSTKAMQGYCKTFPKK